MNKLILITISIFVLTKSTVESPVNSWVFVSSNDPIFQKVWSEVSANPYKGRVNNGKHYVQSVIAVNYEEGSHYPLTNYNVFVKLQDPHSGATEFGKFKINRRMRGNQFLQDTTFTKPIKHEIKISVCS